MIENLTYEEILSISNELKVQADIINNIISTKNIPDLNDLTATVYSYSKFLASSVEMNKDADKILMDLQNRN